MIREIEIKNFRGIEHVKIKDAKRLNVMVGPNGTGKTAFLEAIFLASGNSPEILQRIKAWRGREALSQGNLETIQDAIFEDTFRDPVKGTASINLVGDTGETRSIKISSDAESETVISPGSETTSFNWNFEYDSPKFGNQSVDVRVDEKGIAIKSVRSSMNAHFIGARTNVSESESARMYSKLRVDNKAEAFEKALISEFPILQSLDIEAPWGTPAIYGKLESGRSLPLTMISSGINHLAAILLRLTFKPRSILLVDEIENGFFHDRFGSIWRALHDASASVDGQVFATTHSMECLQALAHQMRDREEEVRFFRSRHEANEVVIEELSGKSLFSALQLGEVR